MSTQTTAVATAKRLEVAQRIDDSAKGAVELFKQAGSFAAELQVAQVMTDLRDLLTDDLMKPVMALQNTDLGFRTDRDPNNKDRDGRPLVPYPVSVVREVFIESKLRGFHTVGNEFNIIAGRFYATKNGFRRKLTDGKTFPGLSQFKDYYDVPRLVGDKGAIVKCRATWRFNGAEDSIEREFPIKVNNFMGSDAILGKAERKLCKAVHDRLAGVITPEAEVGDTEGGTTINVETRAEGPKADFSQGARQPKTEPAAPPTPPPPTTPTPAAGDMFEDDDVTKEIRGLMEVADVTEADLLRWAREKGFADDAVVSINEINSGIRRNVIIKMWVKHVPEIRELKNGGAQ